MAPSIVSGAMNSSARKAPRTYAIAPDTRGAAHQQRFRRDYARLLRAIVVFAAGGAVDAERCEDARLLIAALGGELL